MERIQAQAKICKIKKNSAKAISKQAKVIAKDFWGRWKGKSKAKTIPALMLELEKMDNNKIIDMLAYAKIINKFKPNTTMEGAQA